MGISIFLAKVFGLYLLILGITVLLRRERFMANMNAMMDSRPAMYLSAIMTLILGILLVLSHNIWVANWRVTVTILSWYVFIKGIVRVIFPEIDDRWKHIFSTPRALFIIGIIVLIVAIFFLIMGFWVQ